MSVPTFCSKPLRYLGQVADQMQSLAQDLDIQPGLRQRGARDLLAVLLRRGLELDLRRGELCRRRADLLVAPVVCIGLRSCPAVSLRPDGPELEIDLEPSRARCAAEGFLPCGATVDDMLAAHLEPEDVTHPNRPEGIDWARVYSAGAETSEAQH